MLSVVGLLVASGVAAQPTNDPDQLRIITWNVSWLGHPDYPPADDVRQVERVGDVLRKQAADLYALQEIGSVRAFEAVIEALGGRYSGILTQRTAGQRLGVIYRNEVLRQLSATDAPLAGDSYVFAGRPPLFARFALRGAGEGNQLLIVILHLKAFADLESYERRLRAIELLKSHLDNEPVNTRLVVLGDFNDTLRESIAAERDSPLRLFRRDSLRYRVATAGLEDVAGYTYCASSACDAGAVFDHVILSASLDAWTPVARRVDEAMHRTPDFVSTTSDHLPVALSLVPPAPPRMRLPGHLAFEAVYPLPFSRRLEVDVSSGRFPVEVEMIDLFGRTVKRVALQGAPARHTFDAGRLPAGTYVLRARTTDATAVRVVVKLR